MQQILNNPIEAGLDFYAREGIDAWRDNYYVDVTLQSSLSYPQEVDSFGLALENLQNQMKLFSEAAATAQAGQQSRIIDNSTNDISPRVFITDGIDDEPAIMHIISRFTLNTAQERAFDIIAYHALDKSKVGPQLRMGVFGEGGTGKSRLIAAIHAGFAVFNRQKELVVTAMTGTAAFNVKGTTLHSAINLPIGKYQKKRLGERRGRSGLNVIMLLSTKSA